VALSGLLVGLAEVITVVAFAQAVSAADLTAAAIPSGVDSTEAALAAAAMAEAVIAELNRIRSPPSC
jgi:hypothetical protein